LWNKEKKTKAIRNLLIQVTLLFAFLLLVYYWQQTSPNRNDAKLKELRQLAAETAVFPGFKELATYDSSRATDAGVYKHYYSPSSFQEVVQFYSSELSRSGWMISGEKSWRSGFGFGTSNKKLIFEKGDIIITVQYTGNNPTDTWNYAISFLWYSEDNPAR
jgi:hypothetical protein